MLLLDEIIDPFLDDLQGIRRDELFKVLTLRRLKPRTFVFENYLLNATTEEIDLRLRFSTIEFSVKMDRFVLIAIEEQNDSEKLIYFRHVNSLFVLLIPMLRHSARPFYREYGRKDQRHNGWAQVASDSEHPLKPIVMRFLRH